MVKAVRLEDTIAQLIQDRLDKMVKSLKSSVRFRVTKVYGEDGMFKVHVGIAQGRVSIVSASEVYAMVEQSLEEKYQGIRLMILPEDAKRAAKARRRVA